MSELRVSVRCRELFNSIPHELWGLFEGKEYPWEVMGDIGDYIESMSLPEEYSQVCRGVYIHRGATVTDSAKIVGPCIICDGAEIRHGAYIRGKVFVGRGCVVGNSTEVKNSLLFDGAKAPHFNYVGDSVLGCGAHLGASAIASNLKADKSPVTIHADEAIPTGRVKLGAMVGDGAEVGCGCILNPGTVICREATVYPNLSVRGVVPECSIMKGDGIIVTKR